MADKEQDASPKMWFHPVTGAYIICNTASEVPDGFVDNINKCSSPILDKFEGPAPCLSFGVSTKVKPKKVAKKTKVNKKDKPPKNAENSTLKSLGLSREEAEEILTEDKIKFDANASNDDIAVLVADLLEEE